MRLYEIDDALEALINAAVDRETGEMDPAKLDAITELEGERNAKALAVIAYAKGCDAEADAIEVEIERLEKRVRVHRRHAERLREYVERHLPAGTAISDARSEIRWRKSTAVEVDADAKLPDRFVRVSVAPDKTAIKEALKRGEKFSFARLVERMHMQVK